MSASLAEKAKVVRMVFLVPPRSDDVIGRLARHSDKLGQPTKAILEAFTENTRALLRTLSIPFQLICSQVNALHFQRLRLAARIRLGFEVEEAEGDRLARESAQKRMVEFHASEAFVAEVLGGLEQLLGDSDSSTAAHELSRQGMVLTWSAFEVFARDLFIHLLNRHPEWLDRLLSQTAARKRFAIDKIDWQVLRDFSFNLSSSVGTLLAQRCDLDDILTIRDAFGALFPESAQLSTCLSDERLWYLFQDRNVIVHKRGVVDKHYLSKTGKNLAIGTVLQFGPADIEAAVDAVISAVDALVEQVLCVPDDL